MGRRLSKKEWIAITVAVGFVGYTLFGGNIVNLFNSNMQTDQNQARALPNATSGSEGGVLVSDIKVGDGATASLGKRLKVHYVLALADGKIVQNSKDFGAPFQFTLGAGEVIPGWEIGFTDMKVGGVRTIIVPPEFGYGGNETGGIPPNSTLIFSVELLGVE